MASLAEIRAKLQASDNRQKDGAQGGDRAIYAHWNIPEGTTARVRFLPDGNTGNDFFWVERNMIKLPFSGIKGQTDSKSLVMQVPCIEMYGDSCPILAEVRTWFKDKSLEDMGRKYWKKKSYLFQGFVHESPMVEDSLPENPIRRFIISPQIFNVVKAALMDTEIEELPTDFDRGLDFSIVKTSKGGYADYSTSKWARKETALSNEERAAIDTHGLYDLREFLPKRPTEVELKVMVEMFEASVDGQAYDLDRWGQYFKPYGVDAPKSAAPEAPAAPIRPVVMPAKTTVAEDDDIPFDTGSSDVDEPVVTAPVVTETAPSAKTADILAMIRNRKTQE